ncbi:MAG: DUF2252 family protein [Burkholderiales bacterium]
MPRKRTISERILAWHAGRDPERLQRKNKLLRRDALGFLRGTAFLFWQDWRGGLLDRAPAAWCCGDLHTENFGSFRGFNRLVYFDMTDFDEACLAPASWDLARMLASVRVWARVTERSDADESALARVCLESYAGALRSGRAMWVERATAFGPVRELLRSAGVRKAQSLIEERATLGRQPRLRLMRRKALEATAADCERIGAHLGEWLAARLPGASAGAPEVLDVARRVAGNGSLGIERYVALVRQAGDDPLMLVDVKLAAPSAAVSRSPFVQPAWRNEAERVVAVQQIMQAASPAFLGAMVIGRHAYVVRMLQPSENRLDMRTACTTAAVAEELLGLLGQLLAWNQLRASGRAGAAVADDLIAWGHERAWRARMHDQAAVLADRVIAAWASYRASGVRLGERDA